MLLALAAAGSALRPYAHHIETSITAAIEDLGAAGFTGDFEVEGELVRCASCGGLHQPDEVQIDRIIRIEGASDPGDESIVFGLSCARCDTRGVLVSAYGPSASGEEATVVTALLDARRPGTDGRSRPSNG